MVVFVEQFEFWTDAITGQIENIEKEDIQKT